MNPAMLLKLQKLLRSLSSGKGMHALGKKARSSTRMEGPRIERLTQLKKKAADTPDALSGEDKELLRTLRREEARAGRGEAFARGTAKRRAVMEGRRKEEFFDDGGYGWDKPVAGALYRIGRRPMVSAVGAAAAAPVAYQAVAEPLGRGYLEELGVVGPRGEAAARMYGERADQAQSAMDMRRRRMERQRAENLARLAQIDPHAYLEMATGERLAPGTRVFGGKPRQDILEMVSSRLAEGAYPMV